MEPLFRHLFSPIRINKMEVPNRIVMAPMGTNLGNADGTVSEANLAYMKRRAGAGAGLIITEVTAVHPGGMAIHSELGVYDDRFLPGLKKLVDLVHLGGSKLALQLHHCGRESLFLLKAGKAVAPSPIRSLVFGLTPREMTRDEIQEVISAFGAGAYRAVQAGFDAVEVHGAHGYLLTQFLSALSNQRTDEYGGDLKRRSRFITEVLREVRRRVGRDFPVSLRLSTEEFIKGGYTVEDLLPLLPDFIRAGADVIHASIGTHGSPAGITSAPPEYPPGFNIERAGKMKKTVQVPVIAVGRFTDLDLANETVGRGDADLVAFGRQFLSDPDFIKKARDGRSREIRKCLACNQGCIERLILGEGNIRCAINPETGQETIYPQAPAPIRRKVWIVGGGPAGLTAAYEASRLGHKVELFEKEKTWGGQLRFAAIPPFKKAYEEWGAWLLGMVKKAGVVLHPGEEVTGQGVQDGRPDAVILATGGERIMPDVSGIQLPHVCDAWEILSGEVTPKKNALVIGAGLIGMETADFLSKEGTRVVLVEVLKRSPVLKITSHGYMLHTRLREAQCRMLFNTSVKQIESSSVTITSNGSEEVLSPIDQVVVAVGLSARDDLKKILDAKGIPCTAVGDAAQPRRIIEATEEGAKAAWKI